MTTDLVEPEKEILRGIAKCITVLHTLINERSVLSVSGNISLRTLDDLVKETKLDITEVKKQLKLGMGEGYLTVEEINGKVYCSLNPEQYELATTVFQFLATYPLRK